MTKLVLRAFRDDDGDDNDRHDGQPPEGQPATDTPAADGSDEASTLDDRLWESLGALHESVAALRRVENEVLHRYDGMTEALKRVSNAVASMRNLKTQVDQRQIVWGQTVRTTRSEATRTPIWAGWTVQRSVGFQTTRGAQRYCRDGAETFEAARTMLFGDDTQPNGNGHAELTALLDHMASFLELSEQVLTAKLEAITGLAQRNDEHDVEPD